MTQIPIRRALLSVHDKTGLLELAKALLAHGVQLISTGGTARALREAGLLVTEVEDLTGDPEILDGRVKTLHPVIHAGLLARRGSPVHMRTLQEHGIQTIDLLVSNLYPFEQTVLSGADTDACIEQIDIGGPAMVRSAAKNHESVAVLTDPADYPRLIEAMDAGGTEIALRRLLAVKAFGRIAAYDAAIASWFSHVIEDPFPEVLAVAGRLGQRLRYGENPHQQAALYLTGEPRPGVATARQVQGKELSYNNLNDTDAAFELVAEFTEPAVAIIKHASPCGVATAPLLVDAYAGALAADEQSAFGGIVALNRPLDAATAGQITRIFTEVVIAPGASEEAIAAFAAKPNLRLLLTEGLPDPHAGGRLLRSLAGSLLVQDRDTGLKLPDEMTCATARHPTEAELADLLLAWKVAKHVRSNAIVLVAGGRTVGIGGGQTSRVDAVEIAVRKAARAGHQGPFVLASDAFFPFADGLQLAIQAGVSAVIQPGGSMRDNEVVQAADAANVAMLLTGMRHFRH